MKNRAYITIIAVFILSLFVACKNSTYTPKKKGYFKIEFPERKYQVFNKPGYPYSFEYPAYSTILRDSTFFGEKAENPWWINIDIPAFNARIYISYKDVKKHNFDSLVNDGFKMAFKQHTERASGIDNVPIHTPVAEGFYFTLKGEVATANQFFLTDSTDHFLRGALYFDAPPNEDSLRIVNDFLKVDLMHLINTLKWKVPGSVAKTSDNAMSFAFRKPENEKAELKK